MERPDINDVVIACRAVMAAPQGSQQARDAVSRWEELARQVAGQTGDHPADVELCSIQRAESEPDPDTAPAGPGPDRKTAIKTIRDALRRRSGRAWSVTGGTGTTWGCITITAPPARRPGGKADTSMTDEDTAELHRLLGLPRAHHESGYHRHAITVPDRSDQRRAYMIRAQGGDPDALPGAPAPADTRPRMRSYRIRWHHPGDDPDHDPDHDPDAEHRDLVAARDVPTALAKFARVVLLDLGVRDPVVIEVAIYDPTA
jgi:hypothetical protein